MNSMPHIVVSRNGRESNENLDLNGKWVPDPNDPEHRQVFLPEGSYFENGKVCNPQKDTSEQETAEDKVLESFGNVDVSSLEDHIIDWKNEAIVEEFVDTRLTEAEDDIIKTAADNGWSEEDLEEFLADLRKASNSTWANIKPQISQYKLRPEEHILDFILSFYIRWGLFVFENNDEYVQMIKDYACYGQNYGESYDDYAKKVRETYKRS